MISYEINDIGDVLARLKPNEEAIQEILQDIEKGELDDEDMTEESIVNCSFFLFIPISKEQKEFVYCDSYRDENEQMRGASLNNDFLFFWN